LKYKRVKFIPIDVSESACQLTFEKYKHFENLTVEPYVGRYDQYFEEKKTYKTSVIYVFLGSSIGNLEEDEQVNFLKNVSEILTFDDHLLVGFDTIYKDKEIIELAYNDSKGIAAEFILNILSHLKKLFNLKINNEDFDYSGKWNEEGERMEMK